MLFHHSPVLALMIRQKPAKVNDSMQYVAKQDTKKLCLCGCDELLKVHKYNYGNGRRTSYMVCDFIMGHDKRGIDGFDPDVHSPRLCQCGCGEYTARARGRYNRFIKKHENNERIPWNKGVPFSVEVRNKMSIARLGKEPANKTGIDLVELHRRYVREKKTISVVSKELGISTDAIKNRLRVLGWSRTTKESCTTDVFREQMRQIRIKTLTSQRMIKSPNKLEKLVYQAIDRTNISYEKQVPLFNKFVVDVLFPQQRLVLEIFGRYWHLMPQNQKRDYSKRKYLEKCGYRVEEFWDDEIKKKGIDSLLGELMQKYALS